MAIADLCKSELRTTNANSRDLGGFAQQFSNAYLAITQIWKRRIISYGRVLTDTQMTKHIFSPLFFTQEIKMCPSRKYTLLFKKWNALYAAL